MISPKT